tara:strand:+ start:243 stop:512 length:270 start_codon:yes stop_codon:yes gene_type:complete
MKKLLAILSVFLFANQASADDHKMLSKNDCNEMRDGILYLLSVADENWKALETNPEGSPDYIEHTAKIKWATTVAADYTTIYKTFCDKK